MSRAPIGPRGDYYNGRKRARAAEPIREDTPELNY
ncbi:hypothetical protein Ptr902_12893 [Pyrenophora tritici-repentis]|nr:hypothetical protein Ptr902_12893 [Pyrenophora tritici-repentis]